MDDISFILDSTLNQVVFGIMALLLLETLVVAFWIEGLRRKMMSAQAFLIRPERELVAALAQNPRLTIARITSRVHRLIEADVGRARSLLGTLEEVGPIIGMMMTVAAFTIALPGFSESVSTDPDSVFVKIGLAMGSTLIGLMVKLIGFVQGARVDAATTSLLQELARTNQGTLQEEPE